MGLVEQATIVAMGSSLNDSMLLLRVLSLVLSPSS